ncbi:MAG: hypothetical protein GX765_01220 [Candidatus Moranbacteria bacterium]|nr:hypothetical protein [Candidatus Moranbacteria bacterium]
MSEIIDPNKELEELILRKFPTLTSRKGYGGVISITKFGNPVIVSSGTVSIDDEVQGKSALEIKCLESLSFKERVFILWRDFFDKVFIREYIGEVIFSKNKEEEAIMEKEKDKDTMDIVSSAEDAGVGHIERGNSGKEINPAGESRRFRIPKEEYRGPIVVS